MLNFYISLFSSCEPVRDKRTDGQARRVMRSIGGPHNNRQSVSHYRGDWVSDPETGSKYFVNLARWVHKSSINVQNSRTSSRK